MIYPNISSSLITRSSRNFTKLYASAILVSVQGTFVRYEINFPIPYLPFWILNRRPSLSRHWASSLNKISKWDWTSRRGPLRRQRWPNGGHCTPGELLGLLTAKQQHNISHVGWHSSLWASRARGAGHGGGSGTSSRGPWPSHSTYYEPVFEQDKIHATLKADHSNSSHSWK